MDESKLFYVCDGQVLRNLGDLKGSLENDMSDDVFKYHCNVEKNDFMNWIMDVVGDKKLAKSVARVKTKRGMIKKLKTKKK